MYKKLLIFTFCTIGLTVILSILPIHGESELYSEVVRLHVLANSDSEEDQALKLEVRDRVLELTEARLSACESRKEAEAAVEQMLGDIQASAEETVRKSGYAYSVSVKLGREEYPTRSYEKCCFPSGEYLSLQIFIGDAEGQNWWCVLFPPLCLSAAADSSEAFAQAGLTGEQYNVITESHRPKYKIRFKLLEAIEGILK